MQDSSSKVRYLRRRLDSLNAALVKFNDSRERLTPGGQQFLDWSMAHLDDVRRDLYNKLDRNLLVANDQNREDGRRRLCDEVAVSMAEFANFILPALNGARSDRVPVEIEPSAQRIANRADLARDVTVVLFGADTVVYSTNFPPDYNDRPIGNPEGDLPNSETEPQPVQVPRRHAGPNEITPDQRFVAVRIPQIDRDSGTMHTIALGHELGHLRVKARNLNKLVKNPPPKEWQDPANPPKVKVDEFLELFEIYTDLVDNWAKEILADAISVKILGPAALLAFGEFVGTGGNWDRDTATHPGSDRRCALMLRLLQQDGLGHFTELAGAFGHYKVACRDAVTRPVHMDQNIIAETATSPRQRAWNTIQEQLNDIVDIAVGSVDPEDRFSVEDFKMSVYGQNILAAGRPFAELDPDPEHVPDPDASGARRRVIVPMSVPTILNAAWLVKINRLQDLALRVGANADNERDYGRVCAVLDGLVLKSIEIAEFQRRQP